jgi:hypothetical protein
MKATSVIGKTGKFIGIAVDDARMEDWSCKGKTKIISKSKVPP